MTPRTKASRPSYYDTFVSAEGRSTSASGTALEPEAVPESQSQRVSPQMLGPPPPHHMPPPPPHHMPPPAPEITPAPAAAGGIHLDLMVPPDAPYARYTIKIFSASLAEKVYPSSTPIDR
ncbi:hypothetical protein N665_0015s0043 [Sinapis alba]|nr:hypothetical protein N665_0015s0043 [Sinapis alba]